VKKLIIALVAATAFTGSAMAADLASQPYTKAPAPVVVAPNWTGFYIFGGGGGGVWDGVGNDQARLSGVALTQDQHLGGDGWFGIVGAGFDWQFNRTWVAGVFADGQFGSMRGTLTDPLTAALSEVIGQETLKGTWAVGVRLGYLVAPNVLSYVNAGYTGTQWSGASYFSGAIPALVNGALFTTPSFTQNGWFVGGGVENSLDIFGIQIPGLFMKTEYRAAYFGRETLPETFTPAGVFAFGGGGGLTPDSPTLKPLVQTISTSLVYRFNWSGPVVAAFSESAMAADLATQPYTKAPAPVVVAPNWTGFYIFGGGGGGVWDGVGNVQAQPSGVALTQDQHLGGDGWFGTVGTGFDWQFNRTWVAGVFADGQFGSMRGTLTDPSFLIGASGKFIGQETLRV
jgi:outer membrane immunogenic protein